jgi:hypothetical protein
MKSVLCILDFLIQIKEEDYYSEKNFIQINSLIMHVWLFVIL